MNELREKGNDAFKQMQFKIALNYYTQAIDTVFEQDMPLEQHTAEELSILQKLLKSNDCLQKCFNNRAQCNLNLECYKAFKRDDATKRNIKKHI